MTESRNKISTAVIGASGYTGLELLRLLLQHPFVDLKIITSRQHNGQALSEVFPQFHGLSDLHFEKFNLQKFAKHIQAVFLCLPHHESMTTARKLRDHGIKVIDLSADFRFQHKSTYEKTYGPHTEKKLLQEAVYGLCEIHKEDIKKSNLIGVPGCYVTSILLALAPLLQNQLVATEKIICDSKSGTSGAGRKVSLDLNHSEVFGNFKAYQIAKHRHRPEIEEKLAHLTGEEVNIVFTPHLLPIKRGILSTIYTYPLRKWKQEKFRKVFQSFYKSSPFVKILPQDQTAEIKNVVGTNFCHLSLHYDDHAETLIILSAIDNLIKGSSGQAMQCFNLMYQFPETTGLLPISTSL